MKEKGDLLLQLVIIKWKWAAAAKWAAKWASEAKWAASLFFCLFVFHPWVSCFAAGNVVAGLPLCKGEKRKNTLQNFF